MPPDRGSVTKTPSKTTLKKESKLSTSQKGKNVGDASTVRSTKTKKDVKLTRESSLSRRGVSVKKEDNTAPLPRERVSSKSRIDAEKLKDVKKDLGRDLSKAKETLARNRTSRNSPHKPTATRVLTPARTHVEGSSKNISSFGTSSVGGKKVPQDQHAPKKASQSPQNKTKVSNLRVVDKTRPQVEKNVQKADKVDEKNRKSISDVKPKKLSRERTRTRTLSPHEVKMARGISPFETQSSSKSSGETEETTITMFASTSNSTTDPSDNSIWTDHIPLQTEHDDIHNYEDDFEDYESDFEEDLPGTSDNSTSINEMTSDSDNGSGDESNASENELTELSNRPAVEEEKKMDSGNYDLAESKRKSRELQQIKEALQKENADVSSLERRSRDSLARHPSVAQDEGFEEEKTSEQKSACGTKKAVFINFANAKKKMEEQKMNAKARKRGEELLNMIKLDTVNFSLLDLPPVPYEVYMKSYGRSNTQQAYVQTNEDNLTEEIQTDEILTENKWTQNPVTYHPFISKDNTTTSLVMFSQDHLGVGGDSEQDPDLWKKLIKYDTVRLNRFLLSAGQAVVQLLEQQSFAREKKLLSSSLTSYFSAGFFNLSVNSVPFLSGRSVSLLYFSDRQPTTILTVHSQLHDTSDIEEAFLGRCMLCVWNILKPSTPEKILVCSEDVTSACFHSYADNLIFGSLCDGTICVWDLQEPAATHCLADRCIKGWVIRSPTYSTAEIYKNEGHLTTVIGIQAIGNDEDTSNKRNDLSPIQVCSVELAGIAIIWTVIQSIGSGLQSGLVQQDLGLAHWGKVRLVRSIAINIFEGLDLDSNFLANVVCQDMHVDPVDPNHFYVCTNSGHVIHCLTSGCKPYPKVYCTSEGGFSPATSIENTCLVGLHYMLVGFEGGIVQLYSRSSSKPLATYSGTGDALGHGPCIKVIQWSSAHPGHFFILDKMSRVHLWNLTESDILPIKTFEFEEEISSMKLSKNVEGMPNYLAVATEKGDVQLYQMKPEFCYQSPTIFEEELKRFRAYTKAL